MEAEGRLVGGPIRRTSWAASWALLLFICKFSAANTIEKCEDLPWKDVDGDSCEDYAKEGWCGEQWGKSYTSQDSRGKQHSAADACCACGGGRRVPDLTVSLPVAPSATPATLSTSGPVAPAARDVAPTLSERVPSASRASSGMSSPASDVAAVSVTPVAGSPHAAGVPDLRKLVKKVHQRLHSRESKVAAREAKLAEREERAAQLEAKARAAQKLADDAKKEATSQMEAKARAAQQLADEAKKEAMAARLQTEQMKQRASKRIADAKRAVQDAVAQRAKDVENKTSEINALRAKELVAWHEVAELRASGAANYTASLKMHHKVESLRAKMLRAEKKLKEEHVLREAAETAARAAEVREQQMKNKTAQEVSEAYSFRDAAETRAMQAHEQIENLTNHINEMRWSAENADSQADTFLRTTRRKKDQALKERNEAVKNAEAAKQQAAANNTALKTVSGEVEALRRQLLKAEAELKKLGTERDVAAAAAVKAEKREDTASKKLEKVGAERDTATASASEAWQHAHRAAKAANSSAHVAARARRVAEKSSRLLKQAGVERDVAAAAAVKAEHKVHKLKNLTHKVLTHAHKTVKSVEAAVKYNVPVVHRTQKMSNETSKVAFLN